MAGVFDLRDLNRATLARQGLLERRTAGVADVVRDVGGLQAQLPGAPVIGLWSRVAGFRRKELVEAAQAGRVVRGTTLRGTLHLHEVDDYRALRTTLQPMLDSLSRAQLARLHDGDVQPAVDAARALFEHGPVTVGQLKAHLAERFPHSQPQGLGNVARMAIPLLLEPSAGAPDGWTANNAPITLATTLVGETLAPANPERVVRRFLEVLGPGTVKDVQTWTSMRGLKAVVHGMADSGELEVVTTFEGADLFDLPGAPRPAGDAPASVRFLPMWDNLLLSHADRSRVIDPAHKPYLASKNGMPPPTFLVDGFVHGTWRIERDGTERATLLLSPFGRTTAAARDALLEEGEALLRFLAPERSQRVVRFG